MNFQYKRIASSHLFKKYLIFNISPLSISLVRLFNKIKYNYQKIIYKKRIKCWKHFNQKQ